MTEIVPVGCHPCTSRINDSHAHVSGEVTVPPGIGEPGWALETPLPYLLLQERTLGAVQGKDLDHPAVRGGLPADPGSGFVQTV